MCARGRRAVALIGMLTLQIMPVMADCGGYMPDAIKTMIKLNRALVKIETSGGPDKPCRNEGSGFIVSAGNRKIVIVTAKHVISDDESCTGKMDIIGRLGAKPEAEIPLSVERRGASDLIFLSASNETIKAALGGSYLACRLSLGKPGTPVEQLLLLGYYPGDVTPLPGAGFIETLPDPGGTRQRICGAINHGLSGGPASDKNGDILGIMRERIEKDMYGNTVVEKGYILPVDYIWKEIASLPLTPEGDICGSAPSTVVAAATTTITIPYQLSETLDDHRSAPGSDIAKWTRDKILGKNPAPLRYPKSYQRVFPAIPGYKIIAVRGISVASHNFNSEPLPTTACTNDADCLRVSPDGKSLIANFRLWSGPKNLDETRGWIDMSILTEQTPLDAQSGANPAPQ